MYILLCVCFSLNHFKVVKGLKGTILIQFHLGVIAAHCLASSRCISPNRSIQTQAAAGDTLFTICLSFLLSISLACLAAGYIPQRCVCFSSSSSSSLFICAWAE